MQESELYILVSDFVEKKYGCFFVTVEAGKQGIGSVDVFGVRYTNREKSEIETIGVEVKTNMVSPCADFGQAKGYSVFCHKTYFASIDEFNRDHLEIARHLGIGLVQIKRIDSNLVCDEILEAPASKPVKKLLDYVLESKSIYQCETCKVFRSYKGDFTEVTSLNNISKWTISQIKNGKALRIKYKDGKKEFYCNEHAKIKLGINE